MTDELWTDEFWIPLVDEPIGEIVAGIESEHPALIEQLDSPRKLLAFRTFAYIRVGVVLGRLLMERDDRPVEGKGSETWVEALVRDPAVREELVREVREVAEEVAGEYEDAQDVGPDEGARRRFRAFAKRTLGDV